MAVSTATLTQQLKANQSRYFFTVQGFSPETFQVMSFSSQSHDLSDDYRFELQLSSREAIDPIRIVDLKGQLSLLWDKVPLPINGIVTQISRLGRTLDGFEYAVVLSSPLSHLKLNRQCRVFLKKNVQEIVTDVLNSAGIDPGEFEFKTSHAYPMREYVAQYEESDYAFLSRQLAHWGLFFYFVQEAETAKLIISDNVADMPSLAGSGSLRYQVQTGEDRLEESIYSLKTRANTLSGKVQLKEYNYRTPANGLQTNQSSDSPIKSSGCDYRYGENYKTMEEGEWIALVRMQALDWQRHTFIAESDCCGLAPGYRFTLAYHPDPSLNGDYFVVQVEHSADQRAGDAGTGDGNGRHYSNKLLLIRAGVPYRHPYEESHHRIYGHFTAQVESAGGDYAHIDEQGRYRVRLPFDLGGSPQGEASHAVRMMQPYAGNQFGFHFPLHAGTEVALTCINGDLDRPVINGALPNVETPSPVTSANHTQNILRTWGGNELLMEDRKGEERVELFTRDRQNILSLDARQDAHLVRLASEQGDMKIHAAKTMMLESGDTHTLETGNDHVVVVENNQRLMTKHKDIQLQAATDILFTAKQNIQLEAETLDVLVHAQRDYLLKAGQNASFEVKHQNLLMQVNSGSFQLQAAKAITFKGQGGGKIHIGQAAGAIEIDTSGELNISAPKVTISADTINIKGSNVVNN